MGNSGKTLRGYLYLMRPAEWSKSFGNLIIAAVFAAFTFPLIVPELPWISLVVGMVSIVCLWSGLYTLNDVMDWKEDAKHKVKKNRPIPSGLVSPPSALAFSLFLLLVSFSLAIGVLQNSLFFLCLLIMLVNQILYTTKPFDLKKRPVVDLISGSMVNPVFRFYSGWVLLVSAFNAPLLALVFVVGLQLGGYGLYRLISKDHDKKLGYKSSVVVFNEKALIALFYLVIGASGLSFILMVLSKDYLPVIVPFGSLPIRYILLAVGSLLLAPLYWKPMRAPGKADMQSIYRIIYLHYLFFIVGFVALYYF